MTDPVSSSVVIQQCLLQHTVNCLERSSGLILTDTSRLKFARNLKKTSSRECECYLLEEASRVLTDLREAGDDVVEVEVGQRGVVAALPLHLQQ